MKSFRSLCLSALAVCALCRSGAEVRIVDVLAGEFIDVVSGTQHTRILAGDTVRWRWQDGFHTTSSRDGLWEANIDPFDQTFDYLFNSNGTYRYFCRPHEFFGMVGTVHVVDPTDRVPAGVQVTRGQHLSGGVAELQDSDDQYVVVEQRAQFSPALPNAEIDVVSAAFPAGVESLRVVFEARCSGVPSSRVVQRVQLWNAAQQQWVTVDERDPSTTDQVYQVSAPGNSSQQNQFIDPVTRTVRVRIGYLDRGTLSPGWSARYDQVIFRAVMG